MKQLNDLLSGFEPISLKELEAANLMNRTDVKFSFNRKELPCILEKMKANYKCLNIDQRQLNSYQTLYYDTANFALYLQHHNGYLNRLKVRRRLYVDSQLGFLEVKFKNNQGRTIKERIRIKSITEPFDQKERDFLKKKLTIDPALLLPSVWVDYQRLTFSNNKQAERLTIDLNLNFRRVGQEVSFSELVIAEVKQEGKGHSPFIDLMKTMRIKPNSISKYCLALASTNKELKQNNFKEKISTLNRIINDDTFTIHP